MGAATAFFASSVGLLQNDLKRVIAYSTCSQLGYMVFACGLSDYAVGMFHLANHAVFKALLFLGAGMVIHAVNDEQDMRKMGGLKNLVPFTYSVMTIASLALIGFPFLAGFYSKDLILELAYGKFTPFSHFSYYLGTFGAFLTAFYSTRLACLTFLVKPNGVRPVIGFAHETFSYMFVALFVLAIPSIFIGFCTKDMIVGVGSDFFGAAIYNNPKTLHIFDAEFVEFFYKSLPVTLSLFGASLSFVLYNFQSSILFNIKISSLGRKVYTFLNKKWFFDKLYSELFGQFFFKFGYTISYKSIDRGAFEIISDSKMEMKEGTPQGSILSPLFANILFDRFDRWVETHLLTKFNTLRKDNVNPEYANAVQKHLGTEWNEVLESIKKHAPDVNRKKIRLALREVRKQQAAQDKIKYYADDPNHRKLWYERYADDMLLGLIGPKEDALAILKEIEVAVEKELKMRIHPEKSGVEHHSDGVLFLGYRLLGNYDAKMNYGKTQRHLSNRIKFSIPTKRLLKRYMNKGFLQIAKKGKNIKYVARRVDKWIFLPEDFEVVKRFNAVMRGIANYYCGSEYPSALNELWELMRRSLALTLVHRHKKRTAKAGFQKWGRDLKIRYEVQKKGKTEERHVCFEIPKITYGKFKRPGALQGEMSWLMISTTPKGAVFPKTLSGIVSASELPCAIPHCPNMANEWHHITPRKRAKRKDRRAIDIAYQTRQLPVCTAHHNLITNGNFFKGRALDKQWGLNVLLSLLKLRMLIIMTLSRQTVSAKIHGLKGNSPDY